MSEKFVSTIKIRLNSALYVIKLIFYHHTVLNSTRHLFKGELQCQNMLISFESPSKILQIETKIIKIRPAVLQIFNFKDQDLDSFPIKKTTEKQKNLFLGILPKLKNDGFCDIRKHKCTIKR